MGGEAKFWVRNQSKVMANIFRRLGHLVLGNSSLFKRCSTVDGHQHLAPTNSVTALHCPGTSSVAKSE